MPCGDASVRRVVAHSYSGPICLRTHLVGSPIFRRTGAARSGFKHTLVQIQHKYPLWMPVAN
jgi:hypothetical protein